MKRIIIFLFLGGIILGGGFYGGYNYGKSSVQCPYCQPTEIDFSLFWEAYHRLQEKFVDKDKIDVQKIIYGAISGMVASLEDSYTVFFPPDESKRFLEEVRGTFEGVGMEIGINKERQIQVVSPIEGTPAKNAGLRPGDKILEINGTSTKGFTTEEAANLIRGPRGTTVTLMIMREGWNESQEIKIVRDVIIVPSMKFELKTDEKGEQYAYVAIYQFSEKLVYEFHNAAVNILNNPTQKIVIDLRNNPGGYLEVAQNIAGWFLEKGQIVVIEEFSNGDKQEYKSEGNAIFLDYKVVILINGGTASGSEILAGALRDNRGIKLIGEKSFGKGSVQEFENLSDGSSLKITVAKWLTPKGVDITEKGLEPDIKVEKTDEDYEQEKDPQLDKAVEVLNSLR